MPPPCVATPASGSRCERSATEPAQERALLLGDAAGEHGERQQQEHRADRRLPRGLELGEREEVEVFVGPLEQGRQHREQHPALHHAPAVAGAADHRHQQERDREAEPEVLLRHDLLDGGEQATGHAGDATGDDEGEELVPGDVDAPRRRHPLVVAQRLDGPARTGGGEPPVEEDHEQEHTDADVGVRARRSARSTAASAGWPAPPPVRERMLKSVSCAKRPKAMVDERQVEAGHPQGHAAEHERGGHAHEGRDHQRRAERHPELGRARSRTRRHRRRGRPRARATPDRRSPRARSSRWR